jgi:hypothetical protein
MQNVASMNSCVNNESLVHSISAKNIESMKNPLTESPEPPISSLSVSNPSLGRLQRSKSLRQPEAIFENKPPKTHYHPKSLSMLPSAKKKFPAPLFNQQARVETLLPLAPDKDGRNGSQSHPADQLMDNYTTQRQFPTRTPGFGKTHLGRPRGAVAKSKTPPMIDSTPLTNTARSSRPAFSALQQRFSPKPKAKTALPDQRCKSIFTGPISKEMRELGLDLLHLHLIHRGAPSVDILWHCSAEESYNHRFDDLVASYANLQAKEIGLEEQLNTAAILSWCRDAEETSIDRQIRLLSTAFTEVHQSTSSGGKYNNAILAFEHWFNTANMIQKSREDGVAMGQNGFVEELGDGWKSEVASLYATLATVSTNIKSLREAPEQSDLARCIKVLSTMIRNMQDELTAVKDIERDMVEQEKSWVTNSINQIATDVSMDAKSARSDRITNHRPKI